MKALRASFTKLLRRPSVPSASESQRRIYPLAAAPDLPVESRELKVPLNPPILALIVCSFHHSKGPVIEFTQPRALEYLAASGGIHWSECSPTERTSTNDDRIALEQPKSFPLSDHAQIPFVIETRGDEATFSNFSISLYENRDVNDSGVPSYLPSNWDKFPKDAWPPLNLASRYADVLSIANILPFLALPDGSHKYQSDYVYFLIPSQSGRPLFCISCSRRIPVDRLNYVDDDVTRSHIQKAVCLVSQVPAFGYLRSRLAPATLSFFQQRDFRDTTVLENLFASLSGLRQLLGQPIQFPENPFSNVDDSCWQELCRLSNSTNSGLLKLKLMELTDNFSHIRCVINCLKAKHLFVLMKCILLEKRIIVFGDDAAKVSSFVLGLIGLLPGLQTLGVAMSIYTEPMLSRFNRYGFPLMTFYDSCPVLPNTSLQMLQPLNKCGGFLIGVTNSIYLTESVLSSDVVVTLTKKEQGTLEVRHKHLHQALHPSDYELRVIRRNLQPLMAAERKVEISDDEDDGLEDEETSEEAVGPCSRSEEEESEDSEPRDEPGWKSRSIRPAVMEPSKVLRLLLKTTGGSGTNSARSDRRPVDFIMSRMMKQTAQTQEARRDGRDRRRSINPILPKSLQGDRDVVNDQTSLDACWRQSGAVTTAIPAELVRVEFQKYLENLLRLSAKAAGPERSNGALRKAAESRSLGLSNFNTTFVRMWTETHNCTVWAQEHQLPMMPTLTEPPRNGWARYIYGNGDIYAGQFKHSLRHGQGVYTTATGLSYDGTWANDKRHGFGSFKHPVSEYTYTGGWKDDQRSGQGILLSKREQYWGEFKNNKFNGHGVYADIWQLRYEGDFVDGLFSGVGRMTKASGETYVGEWFQGKQHGHGKMTWKNGRCFLGRFSNGDQDGHGRMSYEDGGIFDGEWKMNKKNGTGIFSFTRKRKGRLAEQENLPQWKSSASDPLMTEAGDVKVTLEGRWFEDSPSTDFEWQIQTSTGEAYRGLLLVITGPDSRRAWETYCHRIRTQREKIRSDSGHRKLQQLVPGDIAVLPHDRGVSVSSLGDRYAGQWAWGLPHGEGSLIPVEGRELRGHWEHGLLQHSNVSTSILHVWEVIHQNMPRSFHDVAAEDSAGQPAKQQIGNIPS